MKLKIIIHLAIVLFSTSSFAVGLKIEADFTQINLKEYIDNSSLRFKDNREIIVPKPVSFKAKIMSLPEKRKVSYIYTALDLVGVNPLPEVNHRMFLAASEEQVIPVYVEDVIAAQIVQHLKVDSSYQFLAYHVYTYKKGPALMIVDLDRSHQ